MKSLDTSNQAEDIQLKIFKDMGPEGRLKAAVELSKTSRKLLLEGVCRRHPEYKEEQIKLAVIRLLLPEKIFKLVYTNAGGIKP